MQCTVTQPRSEPRNTRLGRQLMTRRRGQGQKEEKEPGKKGARADRTRERPNVEHRRCGRLPRDGGGSPLFPRPEHAGTAMTQGPPARAQRPPEGTEAGAGVGHATAGGRGARNEARRVNGSGHARGRPSLPPPLLDTASRRCLRPTDRATRATPTAHAHAPTRGGRWPERHAGGPANESAASGGAGERPGRDAKKRGRCHAPEAQKGGRGWPFTVDVHPNRPLVWLSHYIHCFGSPSGSAWDCMPSRVGHERAAIATLLSAAALGRRDAIIIATKYINFCLNHFTP